MWHRPTEGPKQRHRPFIPGRSPDTLPAVPLQCPQRGRPGDTRLLARLAVGPGPQGATGPTGLGPSQSVNKDMVWGLHVFPAAHRSPVSARSGGTEGLTGTVFPCAAHKCRNPSTDQSCWPAGWSGGYVPALATIQPPGAASITLPGTSLGTPACPAQPAFQCP